MLVYFLFGKQRKVRVGNDPLRHLGFDLYGVKSKTFTVPRELIGRQRLRKGNHRYTRSQDARKAKNNPDEVQPTSQRELNSVEWLKEVEYKKREVDHYTARRLSDGGPGQSFHDESRERLRRKIRNL